MDQQLVSNMLELISTLAKKNQFKGPELTVYLKGLTFAERFFQVQSEFLGVQLEMLNHGSENTDITEDCSTTSD